jgi:hypothetical protein
VQKRSKRWRTTETAHFGGGYKIYWYKQTGFRLSLFPKERVKKVLPLRDRTLLFFCLLEKSTVQKAMRCSQRNALSEKAKPLSDSQASRYPDPG